MNKKKIMSLIMALVMLVGVFSPLTALAAGDEDKQTNSVTLHKIVMDKTTFTNFDKGTKSKDGDVEYDGNEIDNVKEFFAGKKAGKDAIAKEANGVYFAWAKKDNTDNKYYWISKDGKFIDPKVEANETNLDKVPENVFGGKTEKDAGKKFTTTGFSGDYKIFEIHEKSTYVGDDNEALTDMKAVPVEITLPLVNNDGVVTDAHVYPKNTEDKPEIDKNFASDNDLEAVEDTKGNIKAGADYKNYQEKKATAEAELGKKIPYEVKTEIPAKSNLAEAHWDDKMTEGLTYNKDLEVTVKYTVIEGEGENAKEVEKTSTLTKDALTKSGELTQTDKGFSLRLKGENLGLLNGKVKPVSVTLTYSATVNKNAIVDIPEANDITFHYGNTPSKGNTPKPTKPNDNGEVTVEKTWDDGIWAHGESATFKLVDANTGEDVTVDDLVQGTATKEEFDAYKATFEGTVVLKKGTETATHTWKFLNKDKQYKAVEISSTTPSDAEYTEAKDGTIKVTNHKSNNPKPLNPTEPKVVNYGKRFVKADANTGERLQGAEFVIKNAEGKFLALKEEAMTEAEKSDLATAKTNYDNAVKAWNDAVKANPDTADDQIKVTIGKEEITGKTAVMDKIAELQGKYETAFKAAKNAYTWVDSEKADNVVTLVSDEEGKFEIVGLEKGTYNLVETKTPGNYAKINDQEFTVGEGTYASHKDGVTYSDTKSVNTEGQKAEAQRIDNKLVSIPQTGGMGTVLFTIVGISLMAGAVVAMKRNREEA